MFIGNFSYFYKKTKNFFLSLHLQEVVYVNKEVTFLTVPLS